MSCIDININIVSVITLIARRGDKLCALQKWQKSEDTEQMDG